MWLRRGLVRTYRIIAFVVLYAYEFLYSNAIVMWEIVTPGSRLAPAILQLRLRSRSRREIVSLANFMTLTPGTLAVEVRMDPPTLFMHVMHAHDVEAFRRRLSQLEDRMLAAFRPVGYGERPE